MTPQMQQIVAREEKLLCRSYARYPLAISRGRGTRLWDINGKEYIDLLSGIGVCALGHCNEELDRELESQSHKLWHVSNLFYQEEQLDLAEILLSTTHHDKVFFCNSGAEAIEACIKLARRYIRAVRKRDAYEIITLEGCFHGRTMGALAATGRKTLSDGFEPLPQGFLQVPREDLAALEAAITPATAAVLLECVQGEGGVVPLSDQYLRDVEKLCRARDILLLCDEVQCGMGRTGKFWAFQHSGIQPDAIAVSKALANGMAMGAMLATDEMSLGFVAGSHASTFGGGALASRVAHKVVEIILRDNLPGRAGTLGLELRAQLDELHAKYPALIREIRSKGLMTGIELFREAPAVWGQLLEAGFICNLTHGTTLRLLPPLIISSEDLEKFVVCLDELLEAIA